MAQGFDDFSSYTIDTEPLAGWSKEGDWTATTVAIQTDAESPGGKSLRLSKSSSSARSVFAKTGVADTARCQVAMLVRVVSVMAGTSTSSYIGPVARMSGPATSQITAHLTSVGREGTTRDVRGFSYLSGTPTTLVKGAGLNDSWDIGTPFWIVTDFNEGVVTTTIRTMAAPTVVTHTGTFSTTLLTAGKLGLFSFARDTVADVLAFGWGTDGDDALLTGVADVTDPVLSLPTGTTTGATTASGGVTTDEANGTLYAVVTTSATPPSAADIRAGTGAAYATSQAVSATGVQSVAATGLTASTTYYWHYLHDDAAANASNIVTSASFTTSAIPVVIFTGTVPAQSFAEDSAITPLDLSGYFSGGLTPFTYAVTTGTLPVGLTLDASTGIISGTPTTPAAAVSIVVTATDTGTNTAASSAFDITITAVVVVIKGVRVTTSAASVTGITALWWDSNPPTGNPVFSTSTASTDVSGVLELNLDASTSLAVDALGTLALYKIDGTDHQDSIGAITQLPILDVA